MTFRWKGKENSPEYYDLCEMLRFDRARVPRLPGSAYPGGSGHHPKTPQLDTYCFVLRMPVTEAPQARHHKSLHSVWRCFVPQPDVPSTPSASSTDSSKAQKLNVPEAIKTERGKSA